MRGNLDERARFHLPCLSVDLDLAATGEEIERVVVGMAVQRRSAARPKRVSWALNADV